MSESFLKWFENKYGHKYGEYEEDIDVFAAYTAGLLRAAEICKSKHENMDSKLNYVAGWLDAEAAIRKEADDGKL